MEFSGTPERYLRMAVIGSIVLNLFLYLGLAAILYLGHGQTWILGWKPILITVVFTALFARIAWRWIMRLDARFGSGRGWRLESQMVKLPQRSLRR